eukprot:CAMPEP_0194434904 /NCGR_PEP_ID=MMETSP0176-20130528/85734_1 /TAXON_ID=216777 /ORGANISM="Proboscia alata, Strain PI-D3" /LENGTH=112 /DNA_ID=CAMNT_0039253665 /DNA_START=78 /DNA_END=413 /DNA_ORIENTATION=+
MWRQCIQLLCLLEVVSSSSEISSTALPIVKEVATSATTLAATFAKTDVVSNTQSAVVDETDAEELNVVTDVQLEDEEAVLDTTVNTSKLSFLNKKHPKATHEISTVPGEEVF